MLANIPPQKGAEAWSVTSGECLCVVNFSALDEDEERRRRRHKRADAEAEGRAAGHRCASMFLEQLDVTAMFS